MPCADNTGGARRPRQQEGKRSGIECWAAQNPPDVDDSRGDVFDHHLSMILCSRNANPLGRPTGGGGGGGGGLKGGPTRGAAVANKLPQRTYLK